MKLIKTYRRNASGQFIAESPMVLWLLFIGLGFPLMCMVSMGINAVFLYFACRDGAYQCAKSGSFATVGTGGFDTGYAAAQRAASVCPGIQIQRMETTIVEQELATGNTIRQWTSSVPPRAVNPVPTAPGPGVRTATHIYFIQNHIRGLCNPLIPVIPPYTLDVDYKCYVENPQGLSN